MAKPKCKYCLETIDKIDKFVLTTETINGKNKKINLHNSCVQDYQELMEYKKHEVAWFNNTYEQIKELLEYTSEQKLPNSLITRIQDLRNGTITKRGEGRVVKSKDGYKYEMIFDCLLSNGDNIRWAMSNKSFKNETSKINYLMAIVESNINDSYELFNSRERNKTCAISNSVIKEELKLLELEENQKGKENIIHIKKESKGISQFLDEDDF